MGYTDELFAIREAFISSLGEEKDLIKAVNKELRDRGYRELILEEHDYVRQFLIDPAGKGMLGRVGDAYINYIENPKKRT